MKIENQAQQTVDAERLIDAWCIVCEAFTILRTVFCSNSSGEGFQQVVLHQSQPWTVTKTLDTCFETAFEQWTLPKFAPSQPRHRFSIFRSLTDGTYIVFDIDHVLYDAVSMDLMVAALNDAYTRRALPLRSGPGLVDYITCAQSRRDTAKSYWTSYLSDAASCVVHLGMKHPGSIAKSRTNKAEVPYHNANKLPRFCIEQDLTITRVVQAAWSIVLQILTGQSQVCFGLLYSGRDTLEDAEQIVGPLMSVLTCKANITTQTTIRSLLSILQHDLGLALEHSACSLACIQDALELELKVLFSILVLRCSTLLRRLSQTRAT